MIDGCVTPNIPKHLVILTLLSAAHAQPGVPDLTKYVNPFIGQGAPDYGMGNAAGNTPPGAAFPFGMVLWSPDTTTQSGGYRYEHTAINGFSLTHFSGRGISCWQDIPFLPVPGTVSASPAATFSHANENASPGYYAVNLDSGVGVELTVTQRTGFARFSFPSPTGTILVNNGGSANGNWGAKANIRQQQQSVVHYRQRLNDQQRVAQLYNAQLQQQNRMAEYRYQQQYVAHMQQQQIALSGHGTITTILITTQLPSIATIAVAATTRPTNTARTRFGRQCNYGYSQGYQSGQAAREDRYSSGYQNSYAYQDANYGYDGYYVGQTDYNYYFRQGFSRSYEDGYNTRYQYGQYSGGSYSILSGILSQILNLQSLR